eukprot:4270066-Prymnesium_polylepis.1
MRPLTVPRPSRLWQPPEDSVLKAETLTRDVALQLYPAAVRVPIYRGRGPALGEPRSRDF